MSPQIKELLARPSLERLNDWANIGPVQRAALEEFTELVVLECAELADGPVYFNEVTKTWSKPATRIKKHFGGTE